MRKITCLIALLFIIVQTSFAQETYKRIRINSSDQMTIEKLDHLGIDLTCGVLIESNGIFMEIEDYQIQRLESENIAYTVLIDDVTKFYSDRAISELPKASLEIQQEKSLAAQRSLSVSELINNVGQYNECDEIDWAVPTNWNINDAANYPAETNHFGGCLTFDMVVQELDDMRALYPHLISAKTNASPTNQLTLENRTVWMVRISDNPDIDEAGEPETLYQSLIHSRESATVMNQLFFMWYLLENYDTDPAIRNLVNNQALYFIPVFNPDGFVYNQTVAPNGGGGQRKNRNTSGSCGTYSEGIDLNRNSGYYWGNGGSSTSDSCSSIYAGSSAFSENETQIMRDFFLQHDFKIALNHHSFKNTMLHAYAGVDHIPNPRPDEYSKYNHDMTKYNRYGYGPSTSITSLNSGNMNDWMLGGPSGTNPGNGVSSGGTGSNKHTMAWTPENGSGTGIETTGGTYGGFWPSPSAFLPIAKRAMRMNLLAAYFSGKYAQVHDMTQSNLTTLSGDLKFEIERLGQTAGDFTLTVTPVSSNIVSIGGAVTESFTNAANPNFPATETNPIQVTLDQRDVNISYTLDPGILPEELIEYKIVLTSDYATDNVLYEANIKKAYNPNVLLSDDPDTTNLGNWTASGGTWSTTSDAYSGTTAITTTATAPYSNGENKQLQYNQSIDLSGKDATVIQFYGKWDLERSFDYVQIEASLNGTSGWTPLCGKLTKAGFLQINNQYSQKSTDTFQPAGEPLYDGDTQDKWNMEEIVIDASNNSFLLNQPTVFLRFDFKTDTGNSPSSNNNRQDSYTNVDFEGFTFDDFRVIEIKTPCDNTTPPNNLSVDIVTPISAEISWDNIPSATYDVRYREIGAPTWTVITDVDVNPYVISGLSENTDYEVQIATRCVSTTSSYSTSQNFTTTTSAACTGSSVSSYPYTEDFESAVNGGLGLWNHDPSDDGEWTIDSAGTGSPDTGPSGDFDPSNPTVNRTSGNYMYVEASLNQNPGPESTVYLVSPCIDLSGFENGNFSFYYHMFGSDMGILTVDVSTDNGTSWSTINTLSGQQEQSDETDAWEKADINLSAYNNQIIKIRFSGTTPLDTSGGVASNAPFRSDMAIDYINITADVASVSAPPTALCQNITVQLDAAGNATIVAADVDGGSTDDVLITDLSIDIDTFDCSDIGTPVDVTLTVTDGDNQTDTCIATVTVEDQ
ncbi:M14 family zinc carboxypeptidase, partial [Psychroserpens algicola]